MYKLLKNFQFQYFHRSTADRRVLRSAKFLSLFDMASRKLQILFAWICWTRGLAHNTWTADHLEQLKADVLRFLPKDVADKLGALPLKSPPPRQQKIDHVVVALHGEPCSWCFLWLHELARFWWHQRSFHTKGSDRLVQGSDQHHLRKGFVRLWEGSKLRHFRPQVCQGRKSKPLPIFGAERQFLSVQWCLRERHCSDHVWARANSYQGRPCEAIWSFQ